MDSTAFNYEADADTQCEGCCQYRIVNAKNPPALWDAASHILLNASNVMQLWSSTLKDWVHSESGQQSSSTSATDDLIELPASGRRLGRALAEFLLESCETDGEYSAGLVCLRLLSPEGSPRTVGEAAAPST